MATKSISQLDTAATLDNGDLFETAIPDVGSASGYSSKKMTLAQLADYTANDVVYPDFKTSAQSITGAVNQTLANFADEYDDTATYDVGDVVIYAGNLYKCDTAISTPEAFDPTKWTQGKAADFFAGGGDGGAVKVIAYDHDDSGTTRTSYTSAAFNLNAGDVLLVAVMHRSALTTPAGFNVVKSVSNGAENQSLTVLSYVAQTAETKTITITQASSVRMASFWTQLRGVTITDAGMDYSGTSATTINATLPTRPFILFLSNVYTGQYWGLAQANIEETVFYKNTNTKWLSAVLNFNTATRTQYTITPPSSGYYATIGVYITNE